MKKMPSLGKGLSALIPIKEVSLNNKENNQSSGVSFVKTTLVKDNRLQPRIDYDSEKLDDLKSSIKEKGVLQPILVRKMGEGYEVVAGERRLRACRLLNLEEVPVVIREASDEEALVLALVENVQREDLNPIEEATSYKRLIDKFGFSQDKIAEAIGKNRSTISNILRLLNLPPEIQKSIFERTVSSGHARALLSVDDHQAREILFKEIVKKGLSVREAENKAKKIATDGFGKVKSKAQKNSDIITLEDTLQKMFGTKVKVEHRKKRGKIVIEYYSTEDLKRIIKVLTP